ncbi:FIT family protein [Trichoplax sp. H2]|uniref:FIT family protein n=1 Tax=Trichoplax adhaerens TaxID=10228 RepID=B3RV49_TRIAD|nr:hypothetical protein TRIADDRAFT_24039 [Trichoplax adhaerens]EDV25437.1 hypothetical protein TRIADDRAFT_24039 [Trichoplax adhaerens]RDD44119.1 FIT family protein [Trichoplax sp. H2]|eukprot:XP_002111470.1 hypothetical protein TRIADDRAFT_24039 [Trichoplax adhaerens]
MTCFKILYLTYLSPTLRAFIYIPLLLFGSIWCAAVPPLPSYFSNKKNFINVYFAKLSFAWTASFLSVVVLLSSYVYTNCNIKRVARHCCRIVVATVAWFGLTSIFDLIRSATGDCTIPEYQAIDTCYKHGGNWTGFDTSGHCFVMTYFSFLICEEVRILCNWKALLDKLVPSNERNPSGSTLRKKNLMFITYVLDIVGLVSCILLIIWDFVLICTIAYHHTIFEKWAGGGIGIIVWFITYKKWYIIAMSPTLPGAGPYYSILSQIPK